jgi:hypothetical protein
MVIITIIWLAIYGRGLKLVSSSSARNMDN